MANLPHITSFGWAEPEAFLKEARVVTEVFENKSWDDRGERSMDLRLMIALWRRRADEARMQAKQMQEGSVSQEMMLSIAETYHRLAGWEERNLPRHLST